MTQFSYSTIRLKPNTNAQAIRFGAPWVYANELVLDRRAKKLSPGEVVIVEDTERKPLGLAVVNLNSKIALRMISKDLEAELDTAWFAEKIQSALRLREMMFDAPYYRLIHAEADGLPGVIIDRFGDVAVVQPNAAWADVRMDALSEALVEVTGVKHVIKNASGRTRKLEGLDEVSQVIYGQMPSAPLPVPMNGATYFADVAGGQKTGLFFDQRPNHAFVANLSKGARVLDVFSHVGGFSLAALAGGAASAVAVDGSEHALDLAGQGAAAMGMADRYETRRGDAFDVLAALVEEGELFDVVICDPPAFASSKQSLEAGLRAYERVARLAAPLVREGGILGLCSCSHAAVLPKFRSSCVRGIGRAGRTARLIHTGYAGPDHPQHPQLPESGYLKSLFFHL